MRAPLRFCEKNLMFQVNVGLIKKIFLFYWKEVYAQNEVYINFKKYKAVLKP